MEKKLNTMEQSHPLLSIVVPVYNTATYLAGCLESIVNQTYNNIEVIVVDDGSTDGSNEICDRYAEKYDFVFVYHRENQGVSDTRNYGIEHATGKYVMFVDSDDYIASTMCYELVSAIVSSNSDFAICGNYNVSTVGTKARSLYNGSSEFKNNRFEIEITVATLGLIDEKLKNPEKLDRLTPIWARLYKLEIIRSNNIRFIDLYKLPSECLQFNYEYCNCAKSAIYVDKPLYYYRRNTAISVTKPFRDDLIGKWDWWIGYMIDYLNQHHLDIRHWNAFYSRVCCSVIPLGGNALKTKKKVKEIRKFLNKPIYAEAFMHFDVACMPFHWRLFFNSARNRNTYLFFILTWLMRKILMLRKS